MDKTGASKGYVLIIALDDDPTTPLENEDGEILIFDRFDEIYAYCDENDINIDSILVDELKVSNGEIVTSLGKAFEFPDMEF